MYNPLNFMLFFNIIIAVYLLYGGIKGDGKMYENDYPENVQKEYKSGIRKFCLFTGIIMLVLSILELVLYQYPDLNGIANVVSWVNIALVFVAIAVYLILARKKYGKYRGR